MNLCIFGADGRTGSEAVTWALKEGHHITAFVYSENNSLPKDKGISFVVGDVLERVPVEKAVFGCDAVISALGHVKGSDPLIQTKGIENIVNAMHKAQVKRIVSLTGTGVRQKGDRPSLIDRFLNLGVRMVDPARVKDGIRHAQVLKDSGLDWTIVRVLKLSGEDFDGKYHLTQHGPAELTTPRKKVAKIMLDLSCSHDFVGKMPVSSK